MRMPCGEHAIAASDGSLRNAGHVATQRGALYMATIGFPTGQNGIIIFHEGHSLGSPSIPQSLKFIQGHSNRIKGHFMCPKMACGIP
jgi:hypothetical protein